ncbi:cutinase family protein, partial [Nocardioides eburneiflavus]|uniref:cutinase family protein n=1 Tax=Nocardioides eburneiflavus TaxID=2518372 RepID=UPI00143D8824
MHGRLRNGVTWLAATALVTGLAAVTTTAVTTAPASGAPTAAPARPGGCPDVRVVWAGGRSREAAVRELRRVPGQRVSVTAVVAAAPRLSLADLDDVRRQGLRHRHFAGWRAHARHAVRVLDRSAEACPGTMLVLGGHSEGAVVAREAARRLTRPGHDAARRHLGGLWLLGDPLHERRRDQGQRVLEGVLAGRGPAVPRWIRRADMLARSCFGTSPSADRCVAGRDRGRHVGALRYDRTSFFGRAGRLRSRRRPRAGDRQAQGAGAAESARPARVRAAAVRKLRGACGSQAGTSSDGLPMGVRPSGSACGAGSSRRRAPDGDRGPRRASAGRRARHRPVSRGVDSRPANAPSWGASVSDDARVVAYVSTATNLVRGDRPAGRRLRARAYAWDATTGRTELVSVDASGRPVGASDVQVSGSGRYVLFHDPHAGVRWLRDRVAGTSVAVPQGVVRAASLSRTDERHLRGRRHHPPLERRQRGRRGPRRGRLPGGVARRHAPGARRRRDPADLGLGRGSVLASGE